MLVRNIRNSLSFGLLILFSAKVPAGGFQVNLQGQKESGMGHCGTGMVHGASSAFFNPGAFSFADSSSVYAGANLVFPRNRYLEPYPGIYTAETIHRVATPFGVYSNLRLKRQWKWNAGLAIYTPFGSRISYEDDWKGQFVIREMALNTVFFQPTVGYQVSDKIGIGAGYVYASGEFSMRKAIPVQDMQGNYGEGRLTGSASGHGFNAGILVRFSDKLSAGLSYRSGVKVSVASGEAEFSVPAYLDTMFPESKFSTEISLPRVISAGVAYRIGKKSLLAADVNHTGWSSYDTLKFDFEKNTEKLEDIHSPRMYRNTLTARFGLQCDFSQALAVRAGAYYDFTPVQPGYITPETPDADKLGITSGLSYKPVPRMGIDLSFLFIEGRKRTDTNLETGFGGTWKSRAVVAGIGLEYIF